MNRKFLDFAKLFSVLPLQERPIIVGGSAVEIYSLGQFESRDFDVIGNREKIRKFLTLKGFEREGRYYYKDKVVIEVVDTFTKDRVRNVNLGGTMVRVLSIEDVIIDRLNGCKHWAVREDCEHSYFLMRKYWDILDKKYMRGKAEYEGVLDVYNGSRKDVLNARK